MTRLLRNSLLPVLALVVVASPAFAAPKGTRIIDPAEAAKDPDFAVQGEYTGTVKTDNGQMKVGAQVIALGDGKFHSVGYPGGLPGDGWNVEKKVKYEADGGTVDGVTTLKGERASATIKDGVMTVTTPEGNVIATLKKITRKSETLGKKPPKGAIVLFNGKDVKQWSNGKMTDGGLLEQGATSVPEFQSGTLHVEFMTPWCPKMRGQGRGNSGIYVQGRYETQILDSFGLAGKMKETGGIYSIKDPDVNMCFPPLTWQTYDIDFTSGQYDAAGKETSKPRMTVRLNGVIVQDDIELPHTTTAAPNRKPGPEPGPVFIQGHGNPVRYRNIWFLEKK